MPHAYCTTCEATVTVSDGRCLAGHTITTSIQTSSRGRHRAPSRLDRFRSRRTDSPQERHVPRPAPVEPLERQRTPVTPPEPKPAPAPAPTAQPPTEQPPAVRPQPARPAPVLWQPVEVAPRSVYNSSMLEMLGLDEDNPIEPTYVASPAPQPNWHAPAPVARARPLGVERLPSLSDMHAVNDQHTDTGTLIERLWVATEEHDAVRSAAELRADHHDAVPNRTFRWSIIIGAVLVLAIAVAVLQISIRMPARIADEAIGTYQTALTEAEQVVPSTEQIMLAITDPAVTTEGLSDAAVALSELDTASRALFSVASEPLSATPPLVSRAELDALTPIRDAMAAVSQDGLAIERRLGDALTYRLVFAKTFTLPELPVNASPTEISELGVELGLGLAATLDALQALPNDPAFEAHRIRASSLAERFATWQIEYLSALRAGDLTSTSALAEELQTEVDTIHAGVAEPLATVAGWATREITGFRSTLEALQARLP